MSVSCNGEEVSQRWREKGRELLFGEEFEQRGFMIIESPLEGRHKLHDGALVDCLTFREEGLELSRG